MEKIAGIRKGIDYHLDKHIPELIDGAERELIEYWRKEMASRIEEMEKWARRLSKNDHILAETAEYRRRVEELLDNRLREIDQQ